MQVASDAGSIRCRLGGPWGSSGSGVGKTALIGRFVADLPRAVFHTGTGQPVAAELAVLSQEVARAFPSDLRDLIASPYRDWHDALDHLARLAEAEPLLLVLDEFPELIVTAPALPGILRAFLDRSADRTKLRLLLCGSAVRTMWSIQDTRAPLYGRFDLALPVYPFRPREAAEMLPDLSPSDRALVYGIVGGMPLYLSWWRQEEPIADNLLRIAGRPGSPLLTEGRLIMLTEVGGGEQSASVVYAVASGRSRHSEIQDVTGADPTRILDRLIEARLVERVMPVTEHERGSRRRRYRIADNSSPSTSVRCCGTGVRSNAVWVPRSSRHCCAHSTTIWARHGKSRSGSICAGSRPKDCWAQTWSRSDRGGRLTVATRSTLWSWPSPTGPGGRSQSAKPSGGSGSMLAGSGTRWWPRPGP